MAGQAAQKPWVIGNFSGSADFAGICILIILKKCQDVARVVAVTITNSPFIYQEGLGESNKQMFPQFRRINNESGLILFFVLMTAIIIMIFSVGIMSQSLNEVNYGQQQIDQIISDQLAKGLFWNSYSTGNLSNIGISTTTINGRVYQMQLNLINGNSFQSVVNYDTV